MGIIQGKFRAATHLAAQKVENFLTDWLVDQTAREELGAVHQWSIDHAVRLRQRALLQLHGSEGAGQCWEGLEVHSGAPLKVYYFGFQNAIKAHSPEYLRHILFQPGSVSINELGNLAIDQLNPALDRARHAADLVIVENNPLLTPYPQGGLTVKTPTWIRVLFQYRPDETRTDILRRMRSQKWNIKKIESSGWRFSISKSTGDLEHFYHHLYLPLAINRHGPYAAVDTYSGMLKHFKRGILVCLRDQDEKMVSGWLCLIRKRIFYAASAGVLNGDKELLDRGALGAMYYYALLWAHENGFHHFDAGECRPFATDGIYRHKIRWGMSTVPNYLTNREWTFWVPGNSIVALDWLHDHPLAPVPPPFQRSRPVEPVTPRLDHSRSR